MSGIASHRASPGARAWRGFRGWRRTRPFWGGLFVLLGGAEILFTVWAPLGVVLHVGMQNFIGYLVPYVIILLGVLLWFNPAQRIFYSLIAMICALGSFLTSNMGGFVVGLLFTLVGAALAFAWAPEDPPPAPEPVAEPESAAPAPASPPSAEDPSGVRRVAAPQEQDQNTLPPEEQWRSEPPAWNAPGPGPKHAE
ncbi:DUF6114 domain-containing protein [Actinoplanes sp. HUAS TT8]|uniref:DUF6114 domain-containing protein n=1 Tax=Actinoplanes sp. HUAS TT8 TaxID=3447453 RepID=UPI003F51C30D